MCSRSGSPVVHETSHRVILHPRGMSHLTAVSVRRWHYSTGRGGGVWVGVGVSWVQPPLMRWNRLTSPSVWGGMKNKCHRGWQRASVSYQRGQREWWLLSGPCAPRLFIILRWQGGAGKGERTGSPFVIHHSGGLLPLLSATRISAALVYRCQPIPIEQRAQKMIPLLFLLVQVSLREGWKKKKGPHHLCTTRRAYKHTCRIHNIVVRNKREIMETLVNTAHDEACG